MEDNEIIALYFERNEKAISETASKYGKTCHQVAYNILGDLQDTQECVNDTYMTLWQNIPPTIPKVFSAYILRLLRNISLKRVRTRDTLKRGGGQVSLIVDELAECISDGRTIEDDFDNSQLAEYINVFLGNSPKDDRVIFVSRYWYLMSISDISQRYGYSQSKVKSILFRMRKRLRKYLEKEGVSIEI